MAPDHCEDAALPNLLDLRMPGDTAAIAGVTDLVSEALGKLGLAEEKCMEIALAVQEALANAVVHGCKSDSSKEVRCRLWQDAKGRVLIVISDPGPGFDQGELSDPKHPEHVYADHGRGVYLIHRLMDEVRFEKGGSEIRMWKF